MSQDATTGTAAAASAFAQSSSFLRRVVEAIEALTGQSVTDNYKDRPLTVEDANSRLLLRNALLFTCVAEDPLWSEEIGRFEGPDDVGQTAVTLVSLASRSFENRSFRTKAHWKECNEHRRAILCVWMTYEGRVTTVFQKIPFRTCP